MDIREVIGLALLGLLLVAPVVALLVMNHRKRRRRRNEHQPIKIARER
jgi:hypothetical protein